MKAQKQKTTLSMIIQVMKTTIGDEGFSLEEGICISSIWTTRLIPCITTIRAYPRHLLYFKKLHSFFSFNFLDATIHTVTPIGQCQIMNLRCL
jgi:hypothetical protein